MTAPSPTDTGIPPLALDARRVVAEGGPLPTFSLRTWRNLDAAAKCPRGFTVQGRKIWRFDDLQQWVALGFPDRREFEQRRKNE